MYSHVSVPSGHIVFIQRVLSNLWMLLWLFWVLQLHSYAAELFEYTEIYYARKHDNAEYTSS